MKGIQSVQRHCLEHTCINELSFYFKLNRLEDVGPISTHLDSFRIKLDILEDVGLTCTHLNSYCMVSAIYSFAFYFWQT